MQSQRTSSASPRAIEILGSQVQPTWSLMYQWEALLFQPSFTLADRESSSASSMLPNDLMTRLISSSAFESSSDVY
uniref:Uncharacterized protein n=1 Tax=Knipowitschia caucasica TaxID=637954 RepID=A0AAV2K933_KNICA